MENTRYTIQNVEDTVKELKALKINLVKNYEKIKAIHLALVGHNIVCTKGKKHKVYGKVNHFVDTKATVNITNLVTDKTYNICLNKLNITEIEKYN